MIKIGSIAVKDKHDILKASEILEKLGIKIFSSEEAKKKCLEWDDVKNNYLIQDEDGWRIQSHLLQERFNIETLDTFVTALLTKHPTIKEEYERLISFKKEISETQKELNAKTEAASKELNDKIEAATKSFNEKVNND